ncbi:MAG: hypothetical protein J7L14_03085 [Candidatus Diapherotrites archaeon]|nr:hypothetical protein [Candidatus Diapherotrites archaeon]
MINKKTLLIGAIAVIVIAIILFTASHKQAEEKPVEGIKNIEEISPADIMAGPITIQTVTSEIENCDELEGREKDYCLYYGAAYLGRTENCDKITDKIMKTECVQAVAINNKNVEPCDKLFAEERAYCIIGFAEELGYLTACEKLSNAYRDACIRDVVNNFIDESECRNKERLLSICQSATEVKIKELCESAVERQC